MKELLQEGDVLIFKNGHKKEYTRRDEWMLENYYDDNLNCKTNDKFTIVEVLRPKYQSVYKRTRKM